MTRHPTLWIITWLTTCASFNPIAHTRPRVAAHRRQTIAASLVHTHTVRRTYSDVSPLKELHTASMVRRALSAYDNKPTQVTLWGAKYCRLCARLLPRLESLALRTRAAKSSTAFFKIYHTSATHTEFEAYGIQSLPTLLVRRSGEPDQVLPATLESIKWLEQMLQGTAKAEAWQP